MANLVVLDVDGTVLEKGKCEVSAAAIAAIENISARGYAVMFASGRSYYELIRLFKPLSFEPVYAASDGALCIANGEAVFNVPISKNDVFCIFNLLKSFSGVSAEFCAKYLSYIYKAGGAIRCERQNQIKTVSDITDIEDDIYKITVYGLNSFAVSKLKGSLSEKLRFAYESGDAVEIVAKDADKQAAVGAVCEKFFKGGTKVIAAGDGENDLPVLKNANIPIAMENAPQHIKNICVATVKNICELDKIL